MSLLAGFDFVTEISNAAILKLIKSEMRIGEVLLNPPFDLTIPFAVGSGHLIVDDLQLDLTDDDTVNLHFSFSNSSVEVQYIISRVICSLSGKLSIKLPLKLELARGNTLQVAADTGVAIVTVEYTAETEQAIVTALDGTGLTLELFKSSVQKMVTDFVRSMPITTFPIGYKVIPGVDGSISPLQFSSLQVHCIGHSSRDQQALGLFGNLLISTQNNGNHADKTSTSIASGSDVSISISPGAFHSLIFCPAIAKALGRTSVPQSCGNSPVKVGGLTLTSLVESFGNGQINLFGNVEKSGFCYESSGYFNGNILLKVFGTTLSSSVQINEPNITTNIDFLCYVAGTVLGGIYVTEILFIIDEILDNSDLSSTLQDTLGAGLGTMTNLGGLVLATISSVSIEPEGLILQGMIPLIVPPPLDRSVSIVGSVHTRPTSIFEENILSMGTYHTKLWCMGEKDYPYTEYAQYQIATYDLKVHLVATPLRRAVYAVKAGSGRVELDSDSLSVTLPGVTCMYPLPLATAGTKVIQDVHLDCKIKGTQIELQNRPEEGNFFIELEASSLLDCKGEILNISKTPSTYLFFEGSHVEIGGGHLEDTIHCQLEAARELHLTDDQIAALNGDLTGINDPHPEWGMVEHMVEHIRVLTELKTPYAEEMLLHSQIANSKNFTLAYHALSNNQMIKEIEATKQAPFKAIETELKTQITMLETRLGQIQRAGRLPKRARAFNNRLM